MKRFSHIPWILGCALLLVAAGWWLHARQPVTYRETVRFIDRPVPVKIPPQHDVRPSRPVPATPAIDAAIAERIRRAADADSLELLVWDLTRPKEAFFQDTLDIIASDSAFQLQLIRSERIVASALADSIERWVDTEPALMHLREKEIIREIPIEPTFWERIYYGLPVAAAVLIVAAVIGG
jgi:hypothetical protein